MSRVVKDTRNDPVAQVVMTVEMHPDDIARMEGSFDRPAPARIITQWPIWTAFVEAKNGDTFEVHHYGPTGRQDAIATVRRLVIDQGIGGAPESRAAWADKELAEMGLIAPPSRR